MEGVKKDIKKQKENNYCQPTKKIELNKEMGTENNVSIPVRLSKIWVIRLSVLEEYFDIIKDRINENKNLGNCHCTKNCSQHFIKKIQNSII